MLEWSFINTINSSDSNWRDRIISLFTFFNCDEWTDLNSIYTQISFTKIYFPSISFAGFVTLANHVPVHLRGKKMSKVDTLRAAILYIQDLQEALQNDTALPLDSCSEEAASPLSLNSSDSLPSSPNSSYQAPDLTRQQMSSTMYYQNDSQYNSYAPNHQQMQAPHACVHPTNHSSYQTSPSQYYHSDYSTPSHIAYNQNGFNFDFTRSRSSSDACPSPSSSCYSSDHDPITPEVEAEILEFASWFWASIKVCTWKLSCFYFLLTMIRWYITFFVIIVTYAFLVFIAMKPKLFYPSFPASNSQVFVVSQANRVCYYIDTIYYI